MIKTKYYAVYFLQKMRMITKSAFDLFAFLEEHVSPEECKAAGEFIKNVVGESAYPPEQPIIEQFPELRRVEYLGAEMESKVKYNIKCQKSPKSRETIVQSGIPAKEANDELERYQKKHKYYKGLIWLELDNDSTNAMIAYHTKKVKEWRERNKRKEDGEAVNIAVVATRKLRHANPANIV